MRYFISSRCVGFVSKRPALDDMPSTLLHFHLVLLILALCPLSLGRSASSLQHGRVGSDRALRLAEVSTFPSVDE